MKENKKSILINLLIFIFSTIIMSCWYIILHRHRYENLSVKTTVEILERIGLICAIIPSIVFSSVYYLVKKNINKIVLTFLIFALFIFLIFSVYWLTVNMVFYHLDDSKSFFKSLMETFAT